MDCPPARGDNPRALSSGLSYVQVDKHGIITFYTTYISVDLARHKIFCAKEGKGGTISYMDTGPWIRVRLMEPVVEHRTPLYKTSGISTTSRLPLTFLPSGKAKFNTKTVSAELPSRLV